jgi:SAM-dependent methyltransferase
MTEFDFDGVFGEDYLRFYEPLLSDELSNRQSEQIVQLLDLKPGMRVLDLACGHGRLANRLAAKGIEVVGLDRTALFLGRASEDASERGLDVEYVLGDMRSLPWVEEFDAVINWFTSFGYFSDEENRVVMEQIHKVLVPGGVLAIEHQNLLSLVRNFQHNIVQEVDGDFMIDQNRYDFQDGRIHSQRTFIRGTVSRVSHFSVRLFTPAELADWFKEASFSVEFCGQADGQPLSLDSRRMVVVGRKREG